MPNPEGEQQRERGFDFNFLANIGEKLQDRLSRGISDKIDPSQIKDVPTSSTLNMYLQGVRRERRKVMLNVIWRSLEIYAETGQMPVAKPADEGDLGPFITV